MAPLNQTLEAHPNGVLASTLSTPWLLSLAANHLRIGPGAGEELLSCSDEQSVRDVLFAALVPTAIEGDPGEGSEPHYVAECVHEWLATLAHHLASQRGQGKGGTELALQDLWRVAGPRLPRYMHGLLLGLLIAAFWGLQLRSWLGVGLGMLVGLYSLTSDARPRRLARRSGYFTSTGDWLRTAVRHALEVVCVALALGLVSGLVMGLVSGLILYTASDVGLAQSLADGFLVFAMIAVVPLLFGVLVGPIVGLVSGLAGKDPGGSDVEAHQVIRQDYVFALAAMTTTAVAITLLVAVVEGLVGGAGFGRVTAGGPIVFHYEKGSGLIGGLHSGLLVSLLVAPVVGICTAEASVAVPVCRYTAGARRGSSSQACCVPALGTPGRTATCHRHRLPIPPRHVPSVADG